ncbi:MAG: bifunctional phosphoglucose/phosphomannose isomerase [Candidatus Nealsonbacteria bacterium CG01_land_8_20_14_3_00_12]|uniref:Bifunctional phosphoglucose/phosphomannose isomerase n=2 Tax=Candidatus Nealsoniibacteriota TaxID=1817911 RepID=A0A2M7EBZ9_9BACT|nr:MAG: bifunctional phosphoglucose/phosphomannose isomerase [Candidatus Nealsonbacteria bacterium CG01_land_8_20_14_3_00_12]
MVTKKIDRSNMRQIILDFPRQFRIGIEAAQGVSLKPGVLTRWPENIIICGMGGSGLPGDILVTLRPLDVFSYKSYRLPPQAGNESLIICISYSGDTEETLSSFNTARSRNLPLISITTGGKLGKLSKKYDVPCSLLPPPLIPPRLALGEMTASLVQILVNHHILGPEISEEILKIGASLKTEPRRSGAKVPENQGKKLAEKIFGKIPIIYASRRFREIGWIWKNSLNETAKVLAICNYFPELNHNETVGFWKINEMQIPNEKLYVIILRDPEDSHPRILKQMEIAKDLIEEEGIKVEFIDMKGKTMLEKIFSTVILGFWTAYWLALEYKVDPTPIKAIEELKRRLARA